MRMPQPMKASLISLLCGLVAGMSCAAQPFTHQETGVSLPDVIAGISRGEATAYGASPEDSGIAIPYHSEEVEVTIFIRRLDPKKVSDAASVVNESLAAVKQLEASGTYSKVKIFQSDDASDKAGWSKGAFMAQAKQSILMSF